MTSKQLYCNAGRKIQKCHLFLHPKTVNIDVASGVMKNRKSQRRGILITCEELIMIEHPNRTLKTHPPPNRGSPKMNLANLRTICNFSML